jgi:hypothetical protein
MSDNFDFTPGSGATGAADDVGGVLYPRVKIAQGADGSATDVSSAAPLNVTLANTGANATAVKVDNSAVTQPISAISLPLPTGAATSAKQPALGSAGSAATDVITVQGIASMTALKVDGSAVTQPVSDGGSTISVDDGGSSVTVDGSVAASNFPSTVDTNSGSKSASTIRVVIATDQPQLTNKLLVTPDANSSVNLSQVGGNSVSTGNGTSGTGVQRVTIASDSTGQVALAAGSNVVGKVIAATTTSGGYSTAHVVSAAGNNATSIKGSAGQVYGWYIYNSNASARKVAFHDTSGSPTAGSSVKFSLVIPASGAANVSMPHGIAFSSGIAITTTTGVADSDNGTVASGDLVINIFYA